MVERKERTPDRRKKREGIGEVLFGEREEKKNPRQRKLE
jgi:hypothetical protein